MNAALARRRDEGMEGFGMRRIRIASMTSSLQFVSFQPISFR